MAGSTGFYHHLDRVLARQRRHMLSDLVFWGVLVAGLVAAVAAA